MPIVRRSLRIQLRKEHLNNQIPVDSDEANLASESEVEQIKGQNEVNTPK